MTEKNRGLKRERLEVANRIILAVASCGRRFLSTNSDRPGLPDPDARVSRFELVEGRLWYVDKYRGARIYAYDFPCRAGWGWKFSDGGTLLDVVRHLRDFIVDGTAIDPARFGPFATWRCGGDPWGYGADMAVLRAKVGQILCDQSQK